MKRRTFFAGITAALGLAMRRETPSAAPGRLADALPDAGPPAVPSGRVRPPDAMPRWQHNAPPVAVTLPTEWGPLEGKRVAFLRSPARGERVLVGRGEAYERALEATEGQEYPTKEDRIACPCAAPWEGEVFDFEESPLSPPPGTPWIQAIFDERLG